jgi:hypothetical protein
MNKTLFDYLTPESKRDYYNWKRTVEHNSKPGNLPVYWLEMPLNFVVEHYNELPKETQNLVHFLIFKTHTRTSVQ